ncbi:alpha/beta fold hydrolase [Kribbella swartbergensis]
MATSQVDARKLDVHGTGLAVYTTGEGTPPVVLISGLGDTASVWTSVTARLEKLTTIVSYDRSGCGGSDDLPSQQASRPLPASWAAAQLRELLKIAGVTHPVVLVGHSLGGQIADAFAIRWPAAVAGLVLVDAVDPRLNLATDPARPELDDAVPTRAGRGWRWDVAASADEYAAVEPSVRPPTVVVGSAIWRWFQAKRPELYRPLSLAEVDQRWQLAQLQYARRWRGELIIAHEAGHRLHEEAPGLLATAIAATTEAAVSGKPIRLDRSLVRQNGGSVRPTSPAVPEAVH